MSYASILVALGPDAGCAARLSLAADLARKTSAYLIGAAAARVPVELTGASLMSAALVDAEEQELGRYFRALEERFHAAGGTPLREWRDGIRDPLGFLVDQSRAADLIVAASREDEFAADPGALVLESGRPVLFPKTVSNALDLSHVVIAWKDGTPARRALAGAAPILELARRVFVAGIGDETDPKVLEDVAEHLRRHRVHAEPTWRGRAGRSVGTALLDLCEEVESDLLVSGAYGRSRTEEFVFGGVTRDLMRTDRVSRLMAG